MKYLTSQLIPFARSQINGTQRRNARLLVQFLLLLSGMIVLYSVIFHLLMMAEGREYSWITGIYWTLTVMTTLGFGDITFHSDMGRAFSVVVLLSGMIFLLIVLPFTFIQFFYAPWMEAQHKARAPRKLPEGRHGHVLLTSYDPVSSYLIQRLESYGYDYAVIVSDIQEALRLYDLDIKVLYGAIDRPETYAAARASQALMVAATGNDRVNTNIAFTVREVAPDVPIVTTADEDASVDILHLAGSSYVLRLPELMGEANARRISGVDARSHPVGQFDQLLVAEATAAGTPLVGKTVADSRLREIAGVSVIGLWTRGKFEPAMRDTVIDANSVLLLAGTKEQLERYDELFCIYHVSDGQVIVIGGGRVGRATAQALERREVDYRIIEQDPARIRNPERYILGNAADVTTLERAGLENAPAIVITAHDDDTNIYLTLYCRRLRPDVQIISRATHERNVSTLHRAGADFVLSYASMGGSAILDFIQGEGVLTIAEGISICETAIPPSLAGKALRDTKIRDTGCNVVAIRAGETVMVNPDASVEIPPFGELIFVGSPEAEARFLATFGAKVVTRKPVKPIRAVPLRI